MFATSEQLAPLFPFHLVNATSLTQACQTAEVLQLPEGTVIYKRGEQRTFAHWLINGSVDLVDEAFSATAVHAGNTKPLETEDLYRFTAIVTSDSTLISLPQDTLDLIITVDQATDDETDDDWMTRLLSSRLFEFVPPANIQALFQNFSAVSYNQGDKVIRQGDKGDYFYVIKHGRATIDKTVGERTEHLKQIGPGDFFGEDALISDKKRNATITMLTAGELMRLSKLEFNTLLVDPASEYVTLTELKAVIAGGEQRIDLIDVRHPSEIETVAIKGTKNIPLQRLRQQAQLLDKETVYVVATPGRRAELGALLLTQAGFDSYILKDV